MREIRRLTSQNEKKARRTKFGLKECVNPLFNLDVDLYRCRHVFNLHWYMYMYLFNSSTWYCDVHVGVHQLKLRIYLNSLYSCKITSFLCHYYLFILLSSGKVRATLYWKAFGNDSWRKIISTRSPILVIEEIKSKSWRVNQFSNNNTWFVCTAVEVVELLDANQSREVITKKRGPIIHGNNNVPVLISNQLHGVDHSRLLSHFHQILQTVDDGLPVFLLKQPEAPVRGELCVSSDQEWQLNRLMKSNHNPPQEILQQQSEVKSISMLHV